MTPTIYDILHSEDPTLLPGLRAWLQQHEGTTAQEQGAGSPSFRAAAEKAAADAGESDGVDESGCAHRVLTSAEAAALTCENVSAPVSKTEGVEGREERRTPGALPYRTDPEQPRTDLLKRTRSSLASEVRRLRLQCAKTRRKLREAEERIAELEEAHHG